MIARENEIRPPAQPPYENPVVPEHAFFRTIDGPGGAAYPSETSKPTVYNAQRILNPTFAKTVGAQEISYTAGTAEEHVFFADEYLAEGTIVKAWRINARWWVTMRRQPVV